MEISITAAFSCKLWAFSSDKRSNKPLDVESVFIHKEINLLKLLFYYVVRLFWNLRLEYLHVRFWMEGGKGRHKITNLKRGFNFLF